MTDQLLETEERKLIDITSLPVARETFYGCDFATPKDSVSVALLESYEELSPNEFEKMYRGEFLAKPITEHPLRFIIDDSAEWGKADRPDDYAPVQIKRGIGSSLNIDINIELDAHTVERFREAASRAIDDMIRVGGQAFPVIVSDSVENPTLIIGYCTPSRFRLTQNE